MSKNNKEIYQKEIADLIETQKGTPKCSNPPKNCILPIYLGSNHDIIIGYEKCPYFAKGVKCVGKE
jgi:hypothetical protein